MLLDNIFSPNVEIVLKLKMFSTDFLRSSSSPYIDLYECVTFFFTLSKHSLTTLGSQLHHIKFCCCAFRSKLIFMRWNYQPNTQFHNQSCSRLVTNQIQRAQSSLLLTLRQVREIDSCLSKGCLRESECNRVSWYFHLTHWSHDEDKASIRAQEICH